MNQNTKRRVYYISVIAALVAILASAVIINRTLVNTPEFNIESISASAGEPIAAYMAYIDDEGSLVVGIAEENDPDTEQIISFVRNMQFESEAEPAEDKQNNVADAWVILYDKENKIASRMNFYEGGTVAWYDGKRYNCSPEQMQQLIEYCNANIKDEEHAEPEAESEEEQTADAKADSEAEIERN